VTSNITEDTPPTSATKFSHSPSRPRTPLSGNILDTEESLIVRYEINGGKRNDKVEKRLCPTVADKTDCFRLFQ
jgi:hypothetical protein